MRRLVRLPALLVPTLLAAAGSACQGPSPGPDGPGREREGISAGERAALEEEVREADRAFARSTAERGIDGWLAHMAEDAVRVDLQGETARGHDEIRRMDGPFLEDPDLQFEWEPTEAGIFAGGHTAFTRGRYRLLGPDADGSPGAILARGSYLTVWRREGGEWKVVLDTGAPDPAG